MVQNLPVSEARRRLPSLLKAIQQDPSLSILIRVRSETIATLASVKKVPRAGKAVEALLRLMKYRRKSKRREDASVHSENFKEFLYGGSPGT